MGVSKFFINAGKALINRAGIMTQRQMLAATTKVGRGISEAAAKGDLSAELAGSIIKKALPKGVKAPDFITMSRKETEEWCLNNGLVSDVSKIREALAMAGGANGVNPKNLESLLYLNQPHLNGNIVAHEFRHHLDRTATLKNKISSFIESILSKSAKHETNRKKLFFVAQEKYNELEQMIAKEAGLVGKVDSSEELLIASSGKLLIAPTKAGLLERMGVTEQALESYVSGKINNLLTNVSRKDSIKILKELIQQMQTEVTAYSSGSKISRALGHIKEGESSYSDMSSVFHDEVLKALKKALKQERKAYYKGTVGFKVPKRELVTTSLNSKVSYKTFLETLCETLNDPYLDRFAAEIRNGGKLGKVA